MTAATTVRAADLAAVVRPVDSARGLPNGAYVDPGFARLEREALFGSEWAAIGFAHDAPGPGDVAPVDVLGQPLVMARDHEGVLRVFHNVCRHRGMILVDQPGNRPRALRCPYHSWCYELDGRLRTTPHVGGPGTNRHDAVDRASLGLVEVRSAVWFGVVFVNLDGRAPAFEDRVAALRARWAAIDRPLHFAGPESAFSLDVGGNWKLAVENYCESYHLPWVHPGLNAYSRLEDHYHIEAGDEGFSGQGTTVYRPMLSADGRRFPAIAGAGAPWNEGAEYVALYPNVRLGAHRDHAFAIVLEPRGPEAVRERVAILYPDASVAGPAFDDLRAENARLWKGVFEEDIAVVEGMQRGRHATGFDGGRFSPAMDAPTHAFHAWAAERLAARLGA
ncbi:MAG: aromatic ring-hydroxylating dioxygenase subunit alpha [Paracoccaceae bacterium]